MWSGGSTLLLLRTTHREAAVDDDSGGGGGGGQHAQVRVGGLLAQAFGKGRERRLAEKGVYPYAATEFRLRAVVVVAVVVVVVVRGGLLVVPGRLQQDVERR